MFLASNSEKLRITHVGQLRVSKIFQLRRTSYLDKLHPFCLPRYRSAYSHPLLRDAPRPVITAPSSPCSRDSTTTCVRNESAKSRPALHPLPIVENESSLFDAIRKREWNDAYSILENEKINLRDAIKYKGQGWYGAITALSVMYASRRAIEFVESRRTRKRHDHDSVPTARAPPPSNDDEPTMMDSPELSQRLIRKAEGAIQKRTSRVTVVVERCTNDFNYSAILRTVEALGVQNVWIVDPPRDNPEEDKLRRSTGQVIKMASEEEIEQRKSHHLFAKRAAEWLTVREFSSTRECIVELRETGHVIWATDLSQEAVCLTEKGLRRTLPRKLAIVFGTEAVGCTNEMLTSADERVYLPLRGFADSLNLSVATALVVQQLFHLDPTLSGDMEESERHHLRQKWFAKLASQRLLNPKEKKNMKLLKTKMKSCERMLEKRAAGGKLDWEQEKKLQQYQPAKQELEELEAFLEEKSKIAVAELVKNPPEPLGDMRRADEHRVCYVGRNIKGRNTDEWKDMPATKNYSTNATSTNYFRSLAGMKNGDPK